ncbi:MAG: hypothetical protein AAB871_01960 [Patescibacteria group bacterium]
MRRLSIVTLRVMTRRVKLRGHKRWRAVLFAAERAPHLNYIKLLSRLKVSFGLS